MVGRHVRGPTGCMIKHICRPRGEGGGGHQHPLLSLTAAAPTSPPPLTMLPYRPSGATRPRGSAGRSRGQVSSTPARPGYPVEDTYRPGQTGEREPVTLPHPLLCFADPTHHPHVQYPLVLHAYMVPTCSDRLSPNVPFRLPPYPHIHEAAARPVMAQLTTRRRPSHTPPPLSLPPSSKVRKTRTTYQLPHGCAPTTHPHTMRATNLPTQLPVPPAAHIAGPVCLSIPSTLMQKRRKARGG